MLNVFLEKQLTTNEGKVNLSVNFSVSLYQTIALFGKSGAGKTTLLRMLAGLTPADRGCISVGEEVWLDTNKKINQKVQKRAVGFVFQDYALFPNMTVRQNLRFALKDKKNTTLINELLQITELENLADQKPNVLSGGQQQRVALARALVQQPKLLCLDEPLSALDMEMRKKLQDVLVKVQAAQQTTILLISHTIPEIMTLANQVLVMEAGKLIKTGKPTEIFEANKMIPDWKLKK